MLEFLFNEFASLKPCNFIKKDSNTDVNITNIPVNITKFLRTTIFKKVWERML